MYPPRATPWLRCVVVATILLLLGAFLSSAQAQDQTVTIKVGGALPVWGIPDRNGTSPAERAKRAVFDAFSRKHPNIRLERYSSLAIQGPAAESGILMAYAGGTAPDIVYANFRLLRNYVNQGFLRPLDELVARDPETLKRVQPAVLKELYVDGKLYSVPSNQYVQALYYRKDLFRAAGLDPNRPPRDWNEFYNYAQKLTIPEKKQYGFVFEQGSESYYWINFLWSAGGEAAVKTSGGPWLAAFNNDAGVAALEFYRKLIQGPWTDKNGKTWRGVCAHEPGPARRADISAGRIGMWFAYQSDDIANMNQFDLNPSLLGIAPLPKGPTGKSANEINAAMWGINSSVKDTKKLEACWTFLKYMASDEAARERTRAYVENGLGQLVNPVELKRWGYEEYISANQRPWVESSKLLFETGKPEPNGPGMAFIYKLMNEPLDQALLYPDRPAWQILDASVTRINAKLLNYTPPEVMARRRQAAWAVFWLLIAGIVGPTTFLATRSLVRAARAREAGLAKPATDSPKLPLRIHLSAWAFMAPAVASVAIWAYLPLARGLMMAFQDYRILGGSRWVGMDNFIEAFYQESFRRGLVNSFYFTIWLLGLGFVLPIVVALLLNEIPKGKVLFRVLYYLPAVTTSVVVAMLFKQFWDPSPSGLANTIKGVLDPALGWLPNALWPEGPQKWLQDPTQAMFAVVVPLVWAGAGPGSIIYLAALQSIPDEMYEAADLDGAGFFSKIFRITIPTLTPLIVINLVGATVAAFKIMEPVLVQTGGGPDNATYTVGLEVWYNAFMYLKFGYATAAACMMAALLIGLTMYQLRVLQNVRYSSGNR